MDKTARLKSNNFMNRIVPLRCVPAERPNSCLNSTYVELIFLKADETTATQHISKVFEEVLTSNKNRRQDNIMTK
jgi:hypothetical protein